MPILTESAGSSLIDNAGQQSKMLLSNEMPGNGGDGKKHTDLSKATYFNDEGQITRINHQLLVPQPIAPTITQSELTRTITISSFARPAKKQGKDVPVVAGHSGYRRPG